MARRHYARGHRRRLNPLKRRCNPLQEARWGAEAAEGLATSAAMQMPPITSEGSPMVVRGGEGSSTQHRGGSSTRRPARTRQPPRAICNSPVQMDGGQLLIAAVEFGSGGSIRTNDLELMRLASYRTAPPRPETISACPAPAGTPASQAINAPHARLAGTNSEKSPRPQHRSRSLWRVGPCVFDAQRLGHIRLDAVIEAQALQQRAVGNDVAQGFDLVGGDSAGQGAHLPPLPVTTMPAVLAAADRAGPSEGAAAHQAALRLVLAGAGP